MTNFWQGLRSGRWLTAARARGYSLILLGICAIAVAGWIALSDGLIDRNGKPIGTDFSSFYAAGSLVSQGRAARGLRHGRALCPRAADLRRRHALLRLALSADLPAIAAAAGAVPYLVALAVWLVGSLALYLAVIGGILRADADARHGGRPGVAAVAAGFPAVFINLGHGQNGFLTAGLFGARPARAAGAPDPVRRAVRAARLQAAVRRC